MKCLRCHQDNPSQAKFCLECGTPFTPTHETGPRGQSYADLQDALTESLEQQTATAEILRVISSSPTDVQPVFDTIVQSAVRLCGARHSNLYRVDGDRLELMAYHNFTAEALEEFGHVYPESIGQGEGLAARAVRERRVMSAKDVLMDPGIPEVIKRRSRVLGARSVLYVPMLREDASIGLIVVSRGELKPFSDKEIALITTFADQAVIAIENVRLFTELQEKNRALTEAHAQVTESLEQQTATGEILRVIASSPTDLQPVMEAVAENAARVCGAMDSAIFRLEGEHLRLVARQGPLRTSFAIGESVPVRRDRVGGRAVLDRRTIHVEDIRAAEAEFPETASRAKARGSTIRTMVGTPLLREGIPLGVLFVNRGPEPDPFSAKQIALLETFANQAVIAIENVRLFTELQEKNQALTEAHAQVTESLEQQTATGEILRVISSSPTDVQPVFETIASSATPSSVFRRLTRVRSRPSISTSRPAAPWWRRASGRRAPTMFARPRSSPRRWATSVAWGRLSCNSRGSLGTRATRTAHSRWAGALSPSPSPTTTSLSRQR
jgi:two-component system NtrC family sensor kinase